MAQLLWPQRQGAAAAAAAETKCGLPPQQATCGKSFPSRDEDLPVAAQMTACSPSLSQPIEPSAFLRPCAPKTELHRAGGREQTDTQVRVL